MKDGCIPRLTLFADGLSGILSASRRREIIEGIPARIGRDRGG